MSWYIILALAVVAIGTLIWLKYSKNPHAVLAIGFIIGISIFSLFFYQSRQGDTSLRVVGYSSKLFESDLVKWNVTVQKYVPAGGITGGYKSMNEDVKAFKTYLVEQGIPAKDISVMPISSYNQYDQYGKVVGHNLNQSLFLLSSELDKIEELALDPAFIADRGMILQESRLEYLYTELPKLKQELLSDATSDALARANEIAGSAKTKLGKLREARAGVFQITEPYSTDVSDYGIYNTSTRQKSISVTLTAHFKLR
ncbi:MAG: SIMPL domain-containing protein [Candidatus Cloacimonetes bacterium]|jgi:hypothetical protein|nr:SIMPL domain-containing protein [Candidatus Cloacimonadota bacterium]NLO44063.1 SIMPL domain-containing protein [Candidatus Cloacimonadota bacterium]